MATNLPVVEMALNILVQDYLHDHCNCHTLPEETHRETMEELTRIFNDRIVAPLQITNELNEVFSKQIQWFDVLDPHPGVDRKRFEDCNKALIACGPVIIFCYKALLLLDTGGPEEKILPWANEEVKKIEEFASEEFESNGKLRDFCKAQLGLCKKKIETTLRDMKRWTQALIKKLKQREKELKEQLENERGTLAKKDVELGEKNDELQESEERVQRLQDQARKLEQQLEEAQNAARKDLDALKQQLERGLEEKDVALAEKDAQLNRKEAELNMKDDALQESEDRVRDIQLKEVQEAAQDLKQQLDEKDAALKEAQKKTCCCPLRSLLQKIQKIFTLLSLYVFQGFSNQMFCMRFVFALHV